MTALELFSYPFMQRALIAAFLTGLAAPAIGTYIVQRRLSLMGDGIGHVAVTGVAIGLVTGLQPTWTAAVIAVLGAVIIELIRERGNAGGDVALALLFYGGLAGGVWIAGIGDQNGTDLQGYLFGSITTIGIPDLVTTLVLTVVVVVVGIGLAPQLFAISQDQEFAQVAGLRVRFYNMTIAALAAVSVTVAMHTVGLLLVSALMIIPVATSQQLTRSFRTTLGLAMLFGMLASVGGLTVSTVASLHATVLPGPTIVLVALSGFILAWPVGALLRRRRRPARDHGEGQQGPDRSGYDPATEVLR